MMRASYFCTNGYAPADALSYPGWPTPPRLEAPGYGEVSAQQALASAARAEAAGFDWISCSEHHYAPRLQTPNPFIFAAALSQVVGTARIALLGPLVSMNNPVRVAEEIAQLDQLSGGRLSVLFLRGTPNEFLAYGVNPAETRERTQEASLLITRALSEPEPFGWEGRHYRFRTIAVWPRCIQQPHPPVYYSGNSVESAAFAAANRFGLAISFYTPELVAELTGYYVSECRRHGWEPRADQMLYRCFAAVCEAEAEVDDLRTRFFGPADPIRDLFRGRAAVTPKPALPAPPREIGTDADGKNPDADKGQAGFGYGALQFCGTPEMVVEQIRRFHETTGIGVIDVGFTGAGLDPDTVLRSTDLFATEVLPNIRSIGVPPESICATDV